MSLHNTATQFLSATALMLASGLAGAGEFHVSPSGNDANPGSPAAMLRTISEAASRAHPGDTVTVHEGIYRERVNPPRGGTSDIDRIIFQAAPGEAVTIKGSEVVTNWQYLGNDTWTVTLPPTFFGGFNPFNNLITGDWYSNNGRDNHLGAVYLNGDWLIESTTQSSVLQPASGTPKWFAQVDGGGSLFNVSWFQPFAGTIARTRVDASYFGFGSGVIIADSSEGSQCVGYIEDGDWTCYTNVDLGAAADSLQFRAASAAIGGRIEVRLDTASGTLLGTCTVTNTGAWQSWRTFTASITPTSGPHTLCLVYRYPASATGNTTLWAQFPGKNPTSELVEVNARQSVFYPDRPGRNYITVRGFTLEQAATPWAPPTAEQIGVIGTHWSKGWIIESNTVRYSTCSGIALGKYGDRYDNTSIAAPDSAVAYVETLQRALTNGWNKATIGSHAVRDNHIHHCEQAGIVGSLGCSFSTVTGNDVHDIHVRGLFSGAEMANIKFHGAIDVQLGHNHLFRGNCYGLWLDWMAQGTRVTGNLFHDNSLDDLLVEVDHGPFLIDHNVFLSGKSVYDVSEGGAYAQNIIAGNINFSMNTVGGRQTPYHPPHATDIAGLIAVTGGDDRFYNNLVVAPTSLAGYNTTARPVAMDGNVFLNGAGTSTQETSPLVLPSFNPAIQLTTGFGGYYLKMNADPAWGTARTRQVVTTALLGTAIVPGVAFEQPGGTPWRLDTDYLGFARNTNNPFPGPFESVVLGTNVWKVFNDASVSAPSGLTATAGMSRVFLNWSPFLGAASYNIKRAGVSGGPYTTVATGLTGTAWTDPGVTNGATFFYVVSASDGASEGANSAEASATPQAAIRINSGGTSVGSFSADSFYAGGTTYSNGNAVSTNGVVNPAPQAVYQSERWGVFTYTVPSLDPGTNYVVRLHFAEIYIGAPGGISGGVGSRVFNVLVNGAIVLTNFDIFAAAGGAEKAVVREVTAVADTNGQIAIALAAVTSNPKISGFEILPLQVPAAPTGLTPTPGNGQVGLNWIPVSGADSYRVWRSSESNGTYTVIGSTAATQFTDSNVTNGFTYFYTVSATNLLGESANSPPASATPVAASAAVWLNRAGGSWTVAANWASNTIPNGSGVVAAFNTLTLASNVVVTLDTSPAVGGLLFGDLGSLYSWTLSPGTGGPLTLDAGASRPLITVNNQTAAVSVPLTGSNGFLKSGPGTLALGGANNYSGNTTLGGGVLAIGSAANLPVASAVTLSNGAALNLTASMTLANNVTIPSSQAGTIKLAGAYGGTLTGDYSGVGGALTLDVSQGNNTGFSPNSANGPALGSVVNVLGATGANQVYCIPNSIVSQTFFANAKVSVTAPGIGATHFFLGNVSNGRNVQFGALDGGNASTLIDSDNEQTTLTINGVADGNYAGVIANGAGSNPRITLVKTGTGTQTLSGANTYTGTTTVSNGTLIVNGSLAAGSTVTVQTYGTLGGIGNVAGSVILNGTIAPGTGVGALATGMETWNTGGRFVCELNSTNSSGSDRLNISGALNVQATSGGPFTIKLVSLTPGNTPGLLTNFNKSLGYSWTIATTTGGILNFDTNKFALDATAFGNDWSGGRFALALAGNNLVLNFVAAPTPPRFTNVVTLGAGGMQLTGAGVPGQAYVLQGATNLAPMILWTPIATNLADANGFFQFTDPQAINYQQRFYRTTTP